MTNPDYEAGSASAFKGHPEPSLTWCNEAFHCGWIDAMVFRTPMTPRERRNASEYRAEVVRAYREGM